MKRAVYILVAAAVAMVGATACEDPVVPEAGQEQEPAANQTAEPAASERPDAGGGGDGATDGGTGGGGGPLLLILDASDSMNDAGPDGQPLIDGAKQAMRDLVNALTGEQQVGLRVFGHNGPNSQAGCQDTELVQPVAPLDRPALLGAIDEVTAVGITPIGHTLQEGAGDLPADGPRTIILVSDGKDECAPPDPCEVAADLAADSDGELVIHTVGFALGDNQDARSELECIASATGGQFRDVDTAAELAQSLQQSAGAAGK